MFGPDVGKPKPGPEIDIAVKIDFIVQFIGPDALIEGQSPKVGKNIIGIVLQKSAQKRNFGHKLERNQPWNGYFHGGRGNPVPGEIIAVKPAQVPAAGKPDVIDQPGRHHSSTANDGRGPTYMD